MPKKGTWTVCRFKGGLYKKEGGGSVFEGEGGSYPNGHYESSKKHSERVHFDHSYKLSTMLKMSFITDHFLGTWSQFTEQSF